MKNRMTKRLTWLLENGKPMPWRPLPADVPPGEHSHCFRSCAELSLARPDLRYVEGLALDNRTIDSRFTWWSQLWYPLPGAPHGRLLCHAWLLDADGFSLLTRRGKITASHGCISELSFQPACCRA